MVVCEACWDRLPQSKRVRLITVALFAWLNPDTWGPQCDNAVREAARYFPSNQAREAQA